MKNTYIIFDIETDGLIDTVSKVHCLSYQKLKQGKIIESNSITNPEIMKKFFIKNEEIYYVGHNIINYDIPVLEKLLNITIDANLIDTLALSWYLYPKRHTHGLDDYGKETGILKPKVEDWHNAEIEVYLHRCTEDVRNNVEIFKDFYKYLNLIYDNNSTVIFNLISYLNFKLKCIGVQSQHGFTLDTYKATYHLTNLQFIFENKRKVLIQEMPKELGKVIKTKPKVFYKKDGTLSVKGEEWVTYLKDNNLDVDTEEIKDLPNPGSNTQLKAWLYLLGWKPITFKTSKATGKSVPQVSLPFGQGLCPSVKDLYENHKVIKELDQFFVVQHRIGIFQGYLDNIKDGVVHSKIHGLTKTLRMKHAKPIVNLPKPGAYYGNEVREVLTIPNDKYLLCGSDVSSLEDATKQHYIYYFDPEYVKELRVPGFDPHIDIGVLSGLISKEDADIFKNYKKMSDKQKEETSQEIKDIVKNVSENRRIAKSTNFCATYGGGAAKISETAKIPYTQAKKLHIIYWKRNKAIKSIEKVSKVKKIEKQAWLFNPTSGFWLFLENEKDTFSALNQNTGVFVFDSWLKEVTTRFSMYNIPIIFQYHDELAFFCKKELKVGTEHILREAMKKVNKNLQLNVEITISVDWGNNYKEVH